MSLTTQNPFLHRLQHAVVLTEDDRSALSHLIRRVRKVAARERLAEEGEPTPRVLVMLEGWAFRSKLLAEGERIITDLILPGDICHAQTSILGHADHSVATLTAGTVAEVDPLEVTEVLECRSGAARALRWSSLQIDSILRQSLANNGRRRAPARIAHLVCEVCVRLRAAGVPVEGSFAWPLTQDELADVTGLTGVHVNRSLMALRAEGLIVQEQRRMHVPQIAKLAAFCGFQPDYLHFAVPLAA